MKKKNIILVGFMGTGKTVTGQKLADKTGMPLIDMDEFIELQEGCSITDIFATDGEPAFRALEKQCVKNLSKETGLIISTGGGIVLDPENIECFKKSGLVVCLTASEQTILKRLENDTTRPLLSGDKKTQITTLLESRRSLYDAISHQIDGEQLDPSERAEAILTLYTLES